MKKHLLCPALLLLCAGAAWAFAQQASTGRSAASPVADETPAVAEDGGETGGGETPAPVIGTDTVTGYIYTMSGGKPKFITRSRNYQTRAVLDDHGIPVKVIPGGADSSAVIQMLDNQLYLYSGGTTSLYTDGSKYTEMKVIPQPDGQSFVIRANNSKSTGYVCISSDNKLGHTSADDDALVWRLMGRGDYDALVASRAAAARKAALEAEGVGEAEFAAMVPVVYKSAAETSTTAAAENWAGSNAAFRKTWRYTGLPEGLYTISINAFCRYGKRSNVVAQANSGYDEHCAFLTVNGDSVKIHSILDGKTTAPLLDGQSNGMDNALAAVIGDSTYYIPNTLAAAGAWMDTGAYANSVQTYVGADGKLTVSLSRFGYIYDNWIAYRDLVVSRYGVAARAEAAKAGLARYEQVAAQAADRSGFDAAMAGVRARLDNAATADDVDAATADARAAFHTLLSTYAANTACGYFDLTPLIRNASLDTDVADWTLGGTSASVTWDADRQNCEKFGTTNDFSMKQRLSGLPAGHYTLEVQAFFRSRSFTVDADNYEKGVFDSKAKLTLGDTEVPIRSMHSDARYTPSCTSASTSMPDVGGANGLTVPNGLTGFRMACAQGRYWNVAEADFTAGSNDFDIGVRWDPGVLSATAWMPFDNFRLYYGAPTVSLTLDEGDSLAVDHIVPSANVTLNKRFAAGTWTPLCLPFDTPVPASLAAARILALDGQTLVLQPVGAIEAGRPYMVRAAADTDALTFSGVRVVPGKPDRAPTPWESAMLQGTYKGYTVTVDDTDASAFATREIDFSNVAIAVNVENTNVRNFLNNTTYTDASTSAITKYTAPPVGRPDQPNTAFVPVPLSDGEQTLTLSRDGVVVATLAIAANADHCELGALVPGKTYTYTIGGGGKTTSEGTIATSGRLRMVKAGGMSNIRDLGGWTTDDGHTVRYGLVYRGGEMRGANYVHESTPEARQLLRALGIRADLDLRSFHVDKTAYYGENLASPLGDDTDYLASNMEISDGTSLTNDSNRTKHAANLNFVMDHVLADRPVYFHCVWGADRTGVMAFLIEGLLGLGADAIYKDYELTSFSWAGTRKLDGPWFRMTDKMAVIKALDGKTLRDKFDNYCVDTLGLSAVKIARFRAKMLGAGTPSFEGSWTKPLRVAHYTGATDPGWTVARTGESAAVVQRNTWSTGQEADGSKLVRPFYELWTPSDNTLQGVAATCTLDGLPKGYYQVRANVRAVREKHALADADGLSIVANEASRPIRRGRDIGAGALAGTGFCAVASVVGHVGDDGVLTFGFKADRSNANWLAFDDVTVDFVGDSDRMTVISDDGTHADLYGNADLDTDALADEGVLSADITQLASANRLAAATAKNPNLVVFANPGQAGDDHNVVVDGACDSLAINDAYAFQSHAAFTARSVSYERAGTHDGNIVCLPFSFSVRQAAQLFGEGASVLAADELSVSDGNTVTLSFKDWYGLTVTGGTPCFVRCPGTTAWKGGLSNANVRVMAEPRARILTSAEGTARIVGALRPTSPEGSAWLFDDDRLSFRAAADGAQARPFRAYIEADGADLSGADIRIVVDGLATAIGAAPAPSAAAPAAYDLTGRRVKAAAAPGVYIVGGRKVLAK